MLTSILKSMRPHQWIKNLLVLGPLLFANRYGDAAADRAALATFVIFCLLSSGVYLLNDVLDRERDRRHPVKRTRPIASGRLGVRAALAVAAALIAAGIFWAFSIQPLGGPGATARTEPFAAWPCAYLLLNVGYSVWLERLVIIDCLVIAVGFVIRVHAGAVVLSVATSSWIVLCTFFLALFLAFCKRREEVARFSGDPGLTRPTLREYDVPFLDQLIAPLAALSILSYALYTVSPDTPHGPRLRFTVPFVVFCVFRYLFLVHRRNEGADPARLLLRDRQMLLGSFLWVLVAVWALSG